MDAAHKGQVAKNAAEVYEEFFVPALFGRWTGPVADAAGLSDGHKVLDVACGTGVLAREALVRVGQGGQVIGIDCNDGMLAVARRQSDDITWQPGMAENLPFKSGDFDVVVSQFGLMFFEDAKAALQEMFRVLKPGGRMVVAVWDRVGNTPGYAAMIALLNQLFGKDVADALRAPFSLGDPNKLAQLLRDAGITEFIIDTRDGDAVFPSIDAWVQTDVKGWTLTEMIDEEQYRLLQQKARKELQVFAGSDGAVRFNNPAHIAIAHKS